MKFQYFFTLALFAVLLTLPIFEAKGASLFADFTFEGHKGQYLVTRKNVNVRAKPSNKGKRLSKLKRRDIVDVLGRVKGTQWIATKKDGKELGFVFASSLTPLINAAVDEPLNGRVDMSEENKPVCNYEVAYQGRFEEDEVVFISSDYLAHFTCEQNEEKFNFDAMMFMSEVPHDLGIRPIYQINMDLPEIATGYEEFLSATALFHLNEEEVIMDAVSLKVFKEKELRQKRPASTAKDALFAAIELQLKSFNLKAWKTISGKIPSPGELKPE